MSSSAGRGQRGAASEAHQFTKWAQGPLYAAAMELATCAAADSRKPEAKATSTGSLSLKDCRSHPETPALLLAMPKEASAVGAAPPDTAIPLAEEGSRARLREVDSDCHNRSVRWEDNSSCSNARQKEERVVFGEPHPIDNVVSEVVRIRTNELPPRGRLP